MTLEPKTPTEVVEIQFGIFYEHQLPRPWSAESEHRLISDALAQVEIADRVGFDYVWEVEHHFLEEYSHSSAPEVFLAAASQRTKRIRLGHGIVQISPAVNHPARVAERIATLDLVSDGRVDFGTGEASSAAELGGFGVARGLKREMWEESLDTITRMFVEDPFCGWEGEYLRMPPRTIVPKPLQQPHPPLWVACSRRETILLAARRGIGALSFSFVEPEQAGRWVEEYYRLLASEECVPAGFALNPNVAVVLPMMIADDETEAIERGIDGAHFFGYSLAHFYGTRHHVGGADLWREFQERREGAGFSRTIVTADAAPLGVRLLQAGLGSLRGAIGTPDQVIELIRRYEAAGVDQMIFLLLQAGNNRHDHICESLELFGAKVLPQFSEGRDERERQKVVRLTPAIGEALARRKAPRVLAEPYPIDEDTEVASIKRRRRPPLRNLVRQQVGEALQERLARFVDGSDDDRLDRIFGRPPVLSAIFRQMARGYRPDVLAERFSGRVCYDLRDGYGRHHLWTIEVRGDMARATRGLAPDPAVRLSGRVCDFARMLGSSAPQLQLVLSEKIQVEGNMRIALAMTEMFGGRTLY